MCGIGAIITSSNNNISTELLKKLIKNLLCKLEVRGTDATGMYVYYNDGSFSLLKAPIPASRFVERLESSGALDEIVMNRPRLVMLHTRASTSGSPLSNENNHPLWEVFGDYLVVLVHNGVITNVNAELKRYVRREVDTDMLLAYMRKMYASNKKISEIPSIDTLIRWIRDAISTVEGTSTVNTIWHIYSSEKLVISRDTALEGAVAGDGNSKVLVLASTEHILKDAIQHSNLKLVEKFEIKRGIHVLDIDTWKIETVEEWKRQYNFTTAYDYYLKDSFDIDFINHEIVESIEPEEEEEEKRRKRNNKKKRHKRKRKKRVIDVGDDYYDYYRDTW